MVIALHAVFLSPLSLKPSPKSMGARPSSQSVLLVWRPNNRVCMPDCEVTTAPYGQHSRASATAGGIANADVYKAK